MAMLASGYPLESLFGYVFLIVTYLYICLAQSSTAIFTYERCVSLLGMPFYFKFIIIFLIKQLCIDESGYM